MLNKKGFTLSETLITVAIIGVLAAMLIPTMQKSMPNKNKIMFKKAYNTLLTAVNTMINDDVNYPETSTITIGTIVYQKGFNNTAATTNGTNAKFPYFLADVLNTAGTVTLITTRSATGTATFRTSDGVVWTVYIPVSDATNDTEHPDTTTPIATTTDVQFPIEASTYTTLVTIDVNESGNSGDTDCATVALSNPTVSACSGGNLGKPDTFQLGVRYDGKINVPTADTYATSALLNPTDNS